MSSPRKSKKIHKRTQLPKEGSHEPAEVDTNIDAPSPDSDSKPEVTKVISFRFSPTRTKRL